MPPDTLPASLVNAVRASSEDLRAALEWQSRLKPMPIGEALLGLGKITPEQLSEALHRQSLTKGMPLGQILLDMGLVLSLIHI